MPINENGLLDFPENPVENDIHIDDKNVQWRFNNSEWAIFEPYYIDDLPDVDTSTVTPVKGDLLEWNGTNWVPVQGSFELQNLGDVNVSNLQDDDFLFYDGVNWINKKFPIEYVCTIYLASFSLDSSTEVEIPFNTVIEDTAVMEDIANNRINIVKSGLYSLRYIYSCQAYTKTRLIIYNSLDQIVKIYIGGVHGYEYNGTASNREMVSAFHNFNVGDYVKAHFVTSSEFASLVIEGMYMTLIRLSDQV